MGRHFGFELGLHPPQNISPPSSGKFGDWPGKKFGVRPQFGPLFSGNWSGGVASHSFRTVWDCILAPERTHTPENIFPLSSGNFGDWTENKFGGRAQFGPLSSGNWRKGGASFFFRTGWGWPQFGPLPVETGGEGELGSLSGQVGVACAKGSSLVASASAALQGKNQKRIDING